MDTETPVAAPAPENPAPSLEEPAKPRRRTRKPEAEEPETAPVEEKPKRRARKPRAKAGAAAEPAPVPSAEAPAALATPAPAAPGQIQIPLVDPALRPHRRGRKPKAYVEAEKAAAAALAAAQAQALALAEGKAAPAPAGPAARAEADGPAQGAPASGQEGREAAPQAQTHAAEAPSSEAKDVRPGRGSRSRKAESKAEAAEEPRRAHEGQPGEAQEGAQAQAPRRQHQGRNQQQEGGHDRRDRRDRSNDRRDRNDRQNNRQQNNNRKQRNNRFAPAEPSVSREELAELKVAELRDRARELDLDVTGKKKAELVEEVYTATARAEGFRDIEGILEITNEGFGYIRAHGYMASRDDAFVAAQMIRAAGLRPGDLIAGTLRPSRQGDKYPGLAKLRTVNGADPEQMRHRPKFSDLTPIYPNEPLKMEHGKDSVTGRAIDIVSPIGKGQRGLIVSPPKAGKTTILKKICQSIAANNPEVHLICLLVDERPEEVTDMERSIKGDVVASTFDMPADNHTKVSELVIERAKRIVEMGGDVVVVLDSITRLARAYNLAAPASGRILSGGVDSAALYPPKRFLGAARNIENGGSLTILASALIDTGSKMDEVIFEEFKGTGNMELKLDRNLADRRIFPAIDPVASGTRNEDLLIDEPLRPFVWGIRRVLANMNNTERAAASFIKGLKGTATNQEFLIRTAKKAADHEASL